MYLSHFGLDQTPFGITPNPAFFYTGGKRGEILEALLYAVSHGEGIIKVTGEVGSGKTMLCRMLESRLPEHIEVIYLVNPTLGREEVLYAIAGELGLATGGKRPDEVIRMLQSDLIAKHVAGKQVVLLVEEAQAMPLDTLEEIRLFSNLETAHHKLLQIVLFGQPELDENLALPRMRQLRERITHSFDVPPLEPEVIPDYLLFRMRAAGYRGPNVFSKAAVKRLGSVSQGIVRRISILADKALLAAFADNTHGVDAKHVQAAIADSEFMPGQASKRRMLLPFTIAISSAVVAAGAIGWGLSASQKPAVQPPVAEAQVTARPIAETSPAIKTSDSSPPSAPVTAPVPPTDLIQQRLSATRGMLETEAPYHYSVQLTLMEKGSANQLQRFIQKAESEIGQGAMLVFPTRTGGSVRYGVAHGIYPTRPEAVAALDKLSNQWGYRPQLRTIAGIRQEIERTKSSDLWQQ